MAYSSKYERLKDEINEDLGTNPVPTVVSMRRHAVLITIETVLLLATIVFWVVGLSHGENPRRIPCRSTEFAYCSLHLMVVRQYSPINWE